MTAARRALNAYLGKLESDREEGLAPRPVDSGVAAPEPGQKLAGEVHDEVLDFKKSESEPDAAAREGIDVAIASKEMGHAHISTIVKHYLHLTDGDVTEAVRKRRAAAMGDGAGG